MNPVLKFIEASRSLNAELIAVAFENIGGDWEWQKLMCSWNPIPFRLTGHVLNAYLKAAHIDAQACVEGVLGDGLIVIATTGRLDLGLNVVQAVLADIKLLSLVEVGWWCAAEEIWRHAYPKEPRGMFGRHFSPKAIESRQLLMDVYDSEVKRVSERLSLK